MKGKFLVGLVLVLLALVLGGCGAPSDAATLPVPSDQGADAVQGPEEVVEAFYAWYLGYEGNPLVDKVYHESAWVSREWAQAVDEQLASFDKGGGDPFLCAQDVPETVVPLRTDFDQDLAHVFVESSFEGHGFTVTLQRVGETWQIVGVACEGPETSTPSAPPVDGSAGLFNDPTFGYRFELPAGWGTEEPDIHDSNLPPAGAMERLLHLRPEGWDEDFYPLSLAVYTSESDYRQDHMPGDVVEERAVNGGTLIKEHYDYGERYALQYTFVGPDDLYVLFSDYFRGWPERLEGKEEVAAELEPLLTSFEFTH